MSETRRHRSKIYSEVRFWASFDLIFALVSQV